MARGRRNRVLVPEAESALERMKYEVAEELGIDYHQDRGDLPSRVNGAVGGEMVRRLICKAEQAMQNSQE